MKHRNYAKLHKRLYCIWKHILERCYKVKTQSYPRYGGRGITVCPEWRYGFTTFVKWSKENGYDDSLQIDRIDNNGNYCPENCRWVTQQENQQNSTNAKLNVEKVKAIRTLDTMGISRKQIAKLFSVCHDTIRRVVNGESWQNVV